MLPTSTPSFDSSFSDMPTFGAPQLRIPRRSGTTRARTGPGEWSSTPVGSDLGGPYTWMVSKPESPRIENKLTLRNLSTVLIKNWIYRVESSGDQGQLKVPFH